MRVQASRWLACLLCAAAALTACGEADDGGGVPTARRDGGRDGASADGGDAAASAGPDVVPLGGRDGGAGADGEVCGNGADDNANGRIDEGCPCTPGSSQPCYPRDRAEVGRGPCRAGTQGCDGAGEFGTWSECVGAVVPAPEVCGDGVDQDCSGRADDGAACACRPGTTRRCYTGPMGTDGVGICRAGTQACDPSGTRYGDCLDQVLPRAELCSNGLDDDCNGAVDDGPTCACAAGTTRACYSGPMAEVGRGRCRAGTQTCDVSGTRYGACMGEVGPVMEICGNGIDDDCDGTPDDGCPTLCMVRVDLSGDCLTARCPADCPYPVGCDITMAGGDERGCVASMPTNPVVYFQEGDACGAGRVTGTLRCSNMPGAGLNAGNCRINKPRTFYPPARSGCPAT